MTRIVFWGVRGSIPTVGRDTWRYGGNTPCVEVITSRGTRIILDCGAGLRVLGNCLARSEGGPVRAHILVSHYHWDHIQGIPFFNPFYSPENHFHFYSFRSEFLGRGSLRKVLEAQVARPYSPVELQMMSAARDFSEIDGGEQFDIEDIHVTTGWLHHPQGCLGFRLDTPEGTVVYATDNEPGDPEKDRNLRQLAAGADILIQDAQYSPEQRAGSRRGWGHSSWLEAVGVARDSGARSLVLFHHDPDSSDAILDHYLRSARDEFPATWAATEGMALSIEDRKVKVRMRIARAGQRQKMPLIATVSGLTETGVPFQEETLIRDLSLQGAYIFLKNRPRLQSELTVVIHARSGTPDPGGATLQGTVVHRDVNCEEAPDGVGVVFVDDAEPGFLRK
jgi:phosphoribosyl 1,2-cyclic phosphodiesterase